MQYSLHSVQTQESVKDEAISRKQYAYSYLGATRSHPSPLIILCKGKHRRSAATWQSRSYAYSICLRQDCHAIARNDNPLVPRYS